MNDAQHSITSTHLVLCVFSLSPRRVIILLEGFFFSSLLVTDLNLKSQVNKSTSYNIYNKPSSWSKSPKKYVKEKVSRCSQSAKTSSVTRVSFMLFLLLSYKADITATGNDLLVSATQMRHLDPDLYLNWSRRSFFFFFKKGRMAASAQSAWGLEPQLHHSRS